MPTKINQVGGYDIDLPPDAETNQASMGLNGTDGVKRVYLVYDETTDSIKFMFI